MPGSDRSLFHSWLDGRHPQAGWRVFGPVAQMSKNHRSEQVPETAAMAGKLATVTPLPEMSFRRSSGWRKLWQTHVSRVLEVSGESVVRRRFDRSMQNFLLYYRPLAKVWTLFDNSGEWNYFRWMLVGSGVLCVGQATRLNKANKTPSSACKSTIDSRMDPQHPRRDLVQELSHS